MTGEGGMALGSTEAVGVGDEEEDVADGRPARPLEGVGESDGDGEGEGDGFASADAACAATAGETFAEAAA